MDLSDLVELTNLSDLVEHCFAQKDKGSPYIILVIPKTAQGERIRLSGRRGPLGEILNVKKGETCALFKIEEVLNWIEKVTRL